MKHLVTRFAVLFSLVFACGTAHGATITVGHGGGYDYSTITESLAAAVSGDTILVADGTYTLATGEAFPLEMKQGVLLKRASADILPEINAASSNERVFHCLNLDGGTEIEGFLMTGGTATGPSLNSYGGGIYLGHSTISIADCTIDGNSADENGGGICCYDHSNPTISNCVITNNHAIGFAGGGVFCDEYSAPVLTNCLITDNVAGYGGGGVMCYQYECHAVITNCTISNNDAVEGAGLWCDYDSSPTVTNCIIWGNQGQGIYTFFSTPVVTYCDVQGGFYGTGNIDANPLFVSGPDGAYYLSQLAAGQAANSPCVDAGDPASDIVEGTTRTDSVQDAGIVDMGHHYPFANSGPLIVTGPGPAYENPPTVRVFPAEQDAAHISEFEAYGPNHYGTNVACGDLDGDLSDDILTGAGPGEIYGPHVRGFQVGGTPLPGLNFLAYGTSKWGVNVAAGDIDADGFDEIITGPGPGAVFGPHVRGWNYDGSGAVTAMTAINFFAYGTPKWGVNVSAGDIDGDGYDEIVTGAGPGSVYGPHVRGWDYDGSAIAAIPQVSFLAYGTNQFGVNVSCGDVDGDGIDEIVTAPGPGSVFGAHIRGWDYDGSSVTPLPGLSLFAWSYPGVRYGATVFAGADLDGDGRDDLVVGGGPDPAIATPVSVFRYDGSQVSPWFTLEGYEGMTHGTNVAAGSF